jgi:hypothetical protein
MNIKANEVDEIIQNGFVQHVYPKLDSLNTL